MAKTNPLPKPAETSSAKEARQLMNRASKGKPSTSQLSSNGAVARPIAGTKVAGAAQGNGGSL